jgi:hypothetical protein
VNDNVPSRAVPPVEVIVPLSFGSQVCPVVASVVSVTKKHSPVLASLDPL